MGYLLSEDVETLLNHVPNAMYTRVLSIAVKQHLPNGQHTYIVEAFDMVVRCPPQLTFPRLASYTKLFHIIPGVRL